MIELTRILQVRSELGYERISIDPRYIVSVQALDRCCEIVLTTGPVIVSEPYETVLQLIDEVRHPESEP